MKTSSLSTLKIISVAPLFLILCVPRVYAADWESGQLSDNATVGASALCFEVDTSAGWPRLSFPLQLKPSQTYGGANASLFSIVFDPCHTPEAKIKDKSWVARTVSYELPQTNQAEIIFTRLSPAVLVDTSASTIILKAAAAGSNNQSGRPARGGARGRGRQEGRGRAQQGGSQRTAEPAMFKFIAFVSNGEIKVCALSKLSELTGAQSSLDEPWLLAWYGSATPVRGFVKPFDVEVPGGGVNKDLIRGARGQELDLPVLIRLEHKPSGIEANEDSLTFSFSDKVGKMAIMPACGRKIFLPSETERWVDGLPEEVAKQCRLWSKNLRDYPVNVVEEFSVNKDKDILSVRQKFQWVSFDDDWKTPEVKSAPLPAMLALGLGEGAAVTFMQADKQVKPANYDLMGAAGLAMGIEGADEYTYGIAGLGKYLWPAPKQGELSPDGKRLQARLEKHVSEMLEAGQLQPLFYVYGGIGNARHSHWYWVNTAELAQALSMAYPYLSNDLQSKVKTYLAKEWQDYPPFQLDTNRYKTGAPRNPYMIDFPSVDARFESAARDIGFRQGNQLLELYGIERYLQVQGQKPDDQLRAKANEEVMKIARQMDWAILGPVRMGESRGGRGGGGTRYWDLQGSATYNRWAAGVAGFVRMARSAGWEKEERLGWYLFGKLTMARAAQGRYVAEMHKRGLVRGEAKDDDRCVAHIGDRNVVIARGSITEVVSEDQEIPPFIDLVEPVGRIIGAWARAGSETYLNQLDRSMPMWYISEAPKQSATEQRISPLQHLNGNVLAQYWVLGKKRKAFERYLDTTRFKGDLYFIQNISAAVDSCRQ